MGGIYFDTDMEITKNIDFLLDNKTFIGVEDSGMIACGVWGEQEKESYLSKKMLEFYRNMEHFPIDDLYSISIPRLITNILKPLGFNMCNVNEIQKLEKEIYVYPREFFYPYSYNRDNNCFTDNTCMIHYYDASWVPKWERRENKIYRMFGKEKGIKIVKNCRKIKHTTKKICKIPIYPALYYYRKRKAKKFFTSKINDFKQNFEHEVNDITSWRVGDIVIHKKLGKGVVVNLEGDDIITVDFEKHGIKSIMGNHPLVSKGGHEA